MKDKDDSIIDLRRFNSDDEDSDSLKEVSESGDEFKINHMDESPLRAVEEAIYGGGKVSGLSGSGSAENSYEEEGDRDQGGSFEAANSSASGMATDKVRVKFDKFITLVATHTYEDVLEKNADEDVVISTNLLADLANAHEESKGDKKIVLIFAVGLTIGVILSWLIFRT